MFFSCCGVGVFAFSEPACLGGGVSVSVALSGGFSAGKGNGDEEEHCLRIWGCDNE